MIPVFAIVNSDLMRQMFDLGYHATRHAAYAPPKPPRYCEDPHYMAGYRAGITDRDRERFAHFYPPVPPFCDHSGHFGAMTCDVCNPTDPTPPAPHRQP